MEGKLPQLRHLNISDENLYNKISDLFSTLSSVELVNNSRYNGWKYSKCRSRVSHIVRGITLVEVRRESVPTRYTMLVWFENYSAQL